ncbi:hypothetical protein BKA67DRAFT_110403 [Truncatella angustata]|uniref:Uncharacterized protein n=1 Tax=Truncatella angustata TaxID=152316 RepID=A0A9P8RJN3_9PEZI|nr:uncharacterized protein BKA67DRAFT_110403 [Truncatella angustata]KAH6645316.1 hypothetical protein BKA67DRAFT_110403 [Truncatella angustata]
MEQFAYGIELPHGSRIMHGKRVNTRNALPAELGVPGTLHIFNEGHAGDQAIPCFGGAFGVFPFDTTVRMPRHVHISLGAENKRYVMEKILVMNGVALAELAGELFVIPPMTSVLIAPGVPHTWTAAPKGLDLQELGVCDSTIVSEGKFDAVFEYEDKTGFFPTAQTQRLHDIADYEACDLVEPIRIPEISIKDIIKSAWFVWDGNIRKLSGETLEVR